jgi:hypothetical protein
VGGEVPLGRRAPRRADRRAVPPGGRNIPTTRAQRPRRAAPPRADRARAARVIEDATRNRDPRAPRAAGRGHAHARKRAGILPGGLPASRCDRCGLHLRRPVPGRRTKAPALPDWSSMAFARWPRR